MPGAGIAAVSGIKDLPVHGIRQHARCFAIPQHPAISFILVGIGHPEVRLVGFGNLSNGIGVKSNQLEGDRREPARAQEVHFSSSPATILKEPSAATASERYPPFTR